MKNNEAYNNKKLVDRCIENSKDSWDNATKELAKYLNITVDDLLKGRLTYMQVIDLKRRLQEQADKNAELELIEAVLEPKPIEVVSAEPSVEASTTEIEVPIQPILSSEHEDAQPESFSQETPPIVYEVGSEEYPVFVKLVQRKLKLGQATCEKRIDAVVKKTCMQDIIEIQIPTITTTKNRLAIESIKEALDKIVRIRTNPHEGAALNIARRPKTPLKITAQSTDNRRYSISAIGYNQLLSHLASIEPTKNWSSTLLTSGFAKPYNNYDRVSLDFQAIWGASYEQLAIQKQQAKNISLTTAQWDTILDFLIHSGRISSEVVTLPLSYIPELPKPKSSLLSRLASRLLSKLGI